MTMTPEQMAAADAIGKQAIMEAQAATIDAQAATIAGLREALRGIKSISIEAAEQAGMGLMDGSITPLQRAALRGEVKRCLALVDVCKAALTGAA